MTDSAKPNLRIIVASTRPTRVGGAVGAWVREMAEAHGEFAVQVTDLRALDLPLMNEPHHPSQQNYTKDHTKAWSADIAAADAFVLVMPEYNFSFTAPLKNALDYLQKEWMHKPVGIVSYGGISGGLRAVTTIQSVFLALSLHPVKPAVTIQFVASMIGEDNTFTPTDSILRSATPMLDELLRYEAALRPLRG